MTADLIGADEELDLEGVKKSRHGRDISTLSLLGLIPILRPPTADESDQQEIWENVP